MIESTYDSEHAPRADAAHPSARESSARPAVSVVVPFAGDARQAAAALNALSAIRREGHDELVIADNSSHLSLARIAPDWPGVRVVPANEQRSSYYARNRAAAVARNEWLLFLDADCVPPPDILMRYFAEGAAADEGAIAGEIVGDPSQTSLVARYARDRGYLNQRRYVLDSPRPYAVTANLLVRAAAWRSIGGFIEGVRSGGDNDFAWRLQDVGWRLGYRPSASVVHRHREALRPFARVVIRYAAGRAWLNRRYPGEQPAPQQLRAAARALAAALWWLVRGRRERAAFRAIDSLVVAVDQAGQLLSNVSTQRAPDVGTSPAAAPPVPPVAILTDTFPEVSETFIGAELRALVDLGCTARVEATRRPLRQDLRVVREHRPEYTEDDPPPRKLWALGWLLARHPLRSAADLVARRRWRRDEPVPPLRVLAPAARRLVGRKERHLHAHFARGAALTAMRLARLTGRSYSVTAHAHEIFSTPANLREKLERAAFVTTGCRYNAVHLQELAPAARVHEIVMGVDGERFRRRTPYPGSRRLIAVGRLVEKKGFAHLVEAVATLERVAPIDRLEIVGDGPLRDRLAALVEELGLSAKVGLLGVLDQDGVREALERADLLVMPSVIAPDGDRDSMPVVVKEALALEIPVVASDEVGLPELVEPDWGRLVPPGDAQALAHAVAELLALPPQTRSKMGAAGRAHVLDKCSVKRETERLVALIAQSASA